MKLQWEVDSIDDRVAIFDYLYQFNPLAAEKTDEIVQEKAESLLLNPLRGVEREGIKGRLLIIPDISLLLVYEVTDHMISVLRVLHQKQQYPEKPNTLLEIL